MVLVVLTHLSLKKSPLSPLASASSCKDFMIIQLLPVFQQMIPHLHKSLLISGSTVFRKYQNDQTRHWQNSVPQKEVIIAIVSILEVCPTRTLPSQCKLSKISFSLFNKLELSRLWAHVPGAALCGVIRSLLQTISISYSQQSFNLESFNDHHQ